ncbi:MAG: SH3 domain-containing protein, partial [Campylobacterales bacterium]
MRYYFSLIFIIILFSGCGVKKSSIDIHSYPKLTEVNQESYDEELFSKEVSYHLSSDLVSRFFEVWSTEANIEDSDLWGVDYTKSRIGYGRNLLKYTQKEKNSFIVNADAKNYPSLDRDAILVRDSNFRVMPTSEPFFYNPKKAGEGYPFDYFQNSRVYANTPLKVVHKSLDGAWVYAISYFVKGWVSVEDIVFVDEGFKSEFISSTLVGVVKEPLLIKDRDGFLITKLHIGTLLPFRDNRALLARKFGSKKAFIEKLEPNDALLELPLTPSIKNFTTIAKRMIGEKYSWGGKDGKRDCSMFTRDFYIPFGIYLPRNSRAQAFFEDGEYV